MSFLNSFRLGGWAAKNKAKREKKKDLDPPGEASTSYRVNILKDFMSSCVPQEFKPQEFNRAPALNQQATLNESSNQIDPHRHGRRCNGEAFVGDVENKECINGKVVFNAEEHRDTKSNRCIKGEALVINVEERFGRRKSDPIRNNGEAFVCNVEERFGRRKSDPIRNEAFVCNVEERFGRRKSDPIRNNGEAFVCNVEESFERRKSDPIRESTRIIDPKLFEDSALEYSGSIVEYDAINGLGLIFSQKVQSLCGESLVRFDRDLLGDKAVGDNVVFRAQLGSDGVPHATLLHWDQAREAPAKKDLENGEAFVFNVEERDDTENKNCTNGEAVAFNVEEPFGRQKSDPIPNNGETFVFSVEERFGRRKSDPIHKLPSLAQTLGTSSPKARSPSMSPQHSRSPSKMSRQHSKHLSISESLRSPRSSPLVSPRSSPPPVLSVSGNLALDRLTALEETKRRSLSKSSESTADASVSTAPTSQLGPTGSAEEQESLDSEAKTDTWLPPSFASEKIEKYCPRKVFGIASSKESLGSADTGGDAAPEAPSQGLNRTRLLNRFRSAVMAVQFGQGLQRSAAPGRKNSLEKSGNGDTKYTCAHCDLTSAANDDPSFEHPSSEVICLAQKNAVDPAPILPLRRPEPADTEVLTEALLLPDAGTPAWRQLETSRDSSKDAPSEDSTDKNWEDDKPQADEQKKLTMLLENVRALEARVCNGEDVAESFDEMREVLDELRVSEPTANLVMSILKAAEVIEGILNVDEGSAHSLSVREQMASLIGDVADLEMRNWHGEHEIEHKLLTKKKTLQNFHDIGVTPSAGVLAFLHMNWRRSHAHTNSVEKTEVKHLLTLLSKLNYGRYGDMEASWCQVAFESNNPELEDVEGDMELDEWLSVLCKLPTLQEALEEAVDDLSICRISTYRSPPERMAEYMGEIKRFEVAQDQPSQLQEIEIMKKKEEIRKLKETGVTPSQVVLLFQCLADQGKGMVDRKKLQQVLKQFPNKICGPVLHSRMLKKLDSPANHFIDICEWLAKLDRLPGLKYAIESALQASKVEESNAIKHYQNMVESLCKAI